MVSMFVHRRRELYRLGNGSVLYSTATIRNLHGNPNNIVIGNNTHIRGDLATFWYQGSIVIGDYCYIGEGTRIWSAGNVFIGNRVLISHNVNIFDNDTHPIEDYVARHRQFVGIIEGNVPKCELRERPVVVGDDVLIGCQSIIMPGVTIGKASVIGAGSVVTKDVPPYTLVVGNPARIIRTLFRQTEKGKA